MMSNACASISYMHFNYIYIYVYMYISCIYIYIYIYMLQSFIFYKVLGLSAAPRPRWPRVFDREEALDRASSYATGHVTKRVFKQRNLLFELFELELLN